MKKYILIIIGILLSIKMQAQTAEAFLNDVIEKNKSYNDISIVFNYKLINKELDINENIKGYASIKGNSYILNIDAQEMICNGEVLWTHLIDDEEVMISEVTDDNNTSPIAIIDSFTGNIKAELIEGNNANIATLVIIENEADNFEKVIISVDKKDLIIKDVHVFSLDGNEFIYEITDFKTNQDLPDSMFMFDETMHPNVEIIDMR